MNTYIALFRGINVGGHNKLPMKELSSNLVDLGLKDPRTVIQSGNVVFEASVAQAREIAAHLRADEEHDEEPDDELVLETEADESLERRARLPPAHRRHRSRARG